MRLRPAGAGAGRPVARRDRVGGGRERARARPVRRERAARRAAERPVRAARRSRAARAGRADLVEPADQDRQGGAARAAVRLAGQAGARRRRLPRRAAQPGRRLSAALAGRGRLAGPAVTGAEVTGAAGRAARRPLRPTDVKRLNRSWRRLTRARLALLLDSVGQPFNLGSIIRTAAALGVEQIWLCGDSASPEHPSARKTALGTERLVSWDWEQSAAAAAAAAAASGLRVVAIELAEGAVPLHEAPLSGD